MEIINRLSDVAHDEKLFKWVLESFKAELFDDDNKIGLTLKFRDEIGKYYSKIRKDALIKDDYEIYKVDTFCMVYLAEMFNKIDEEQDLKLKAIKENIQINILSGEMKTAFKNSKANDYLNVLKLIFNEEMLYQYEKTDNKLCFENTEKMLDIFSLKLIKDLFNIKPKFFVGLKKSESCSIAHLGLITVPFDEIVTEDSFFAVYNSTINHIVSLFMQNLFFNGLSESVQGQLIKKYTFLNTDEFKLALANDVAEYILSGTIGGLLKEIVDIIEDIKNETNEIDRKIQELYDNR